MGKDKNGIYRWGCRNCEDCTEFQPSGNSVRCDYCECAPIKHSKDQGTSLQAPESTTSPVPQEPTTPPRERDSYKRAQDSSTQHLSNNADHSWQQDSGERHEGCQVNQPTDKQACGCNSTGAQYPDPIQPSVQSIPHTPYYCREQPREVYYGHQQDRRYISYEGRKSFPRQGDVPQTESSGYESYSGGRLPREAVYSHQHQTRPERLFNQGTSNPQTSYLPRGTYPSYHHEVAYHQQRGSDELAIGPSKIDCYAVMLQERLRNLEEERSSLKNELENIFVLTMPGMDIKPGTESPKSTNQAAGYIMGKPDWEPLQKNIPILPPNPSPVKISQTSELDPSQEKKLVDQAVDKLGEGRDGSSEKPVVSSEQSSTTGVKAEEANPVACISGSLTAKNDNPASVSLEEPSSQKTVTGLTQVKNDCADSRLTVTELSLPSPNSERDIQNSQAKSNGPLGSRGTNNSRSAVLTPSVSCQTSMEKQESEVKAKPGPILKLGQNYPTFHPRIHGKNICIEQDGMTAHSGNSLCSGICFSRYPCKIGQKIHLMITETKKFTGSLRVGFTFTDPGSIDQDSLPSHSYPDLAQKPGFWIKPLHDRLAQQGNVVTFMVDSSGDVFYSINAKDRGLFFSGVDVSGPRIWAAIDVYGSTVAVKFVDEADAHDKGNKAIHEGDLVRLEVDSVETLEWLQEGHGGLGDLGEFIKQDGVVIRLDDEEDVLMRFNSHKKLWCVNPAALQRIGAADPDSSMIIEGDLVTDISKTNESPGRVMKITVSGDYCVKYMSGETTELTADDLRKVKMAPGEACEKGLHFWKRGVAKVCTDCGQCTDKGASCNLKASPLRSPGSPCGCGNKEEGCADCGLCRACAGETKEESDDEDGDLGKLLRAWAKRHEQEEETAHGMTKGDKVIVDTDADTFRVLQEESKLRWNEEMRKVIGVEGTVVQSAKKSVTVQFPDGVKWSLVPGCLKKTSPGQHEDRSWIKKGELVKVLKDERKVKRLQQGHCGYKHDMQASLGKTGCVLIVKKDQVRVEINYKSWWFNPEALTPALQGSVEKVPAARQLIVGDQVKVDLDVETFKTNQAGHGGYVSKMAELVDRVGVVHQIDIDGDVIVYYPNGTRWCINPLSLGKLSPEECGVVDVSGVMEIGDWVKVESDKKKIKHVQERTVNWDEGYYDAAGKVGQVQTTYPFNDLVRVGIEHKGYPLNISLVTKATAQDIHEAFGSGDVANPGIARGDLVKIGVSLEQLKRMQDGHGGFVDHMEEAIGTIGSVSYIDRDGDVSVRFSVKRLCYNPDVLTRVSPVEDIFHVGDIVLIESDKGRLKRLQTEEHGGYNERMLTTCGKTGRLHCLISQTRIRVKVQGKVWVFNPDLLTRMGNPGLGTGDWQSATICAEGRHDWSRGRCLVCVKCGECTNYGTLCPARGKPGRYPGSLCGCGNGDAGCDDCGYCRRCAGEPHLKDREDDQDDVVKKLLAGLGDDVGGLFTGPLHEAVMEWLGKKADKSETPGHDRLERPAPPREEMVPVLKKMSQAIELMRECKNLDSLNAVKNALTNDCFIPFKNYTAEADGRLMADTLANVDGPQVFMDYLQLLSSSVSDGSNAEVTSGSLECIELLRELLISCTHNSFEFCRAVGRCGLLQMLVQDLVALHKVAGNGSTGLMIQSLLVILTNCARTPDNQECFTRCGAAEALKPYLRNRDADIRVLTLSCLAFIVENQNMHLIRLNVDGAELIVSLLKKALDDPDHSTEVGNYFYPVFEIATMLGALVQNDENKQVFVTNGVVDLLLKLIETGNDREKEAAILCVQKLAYSDHIRALIRKDTRAEEVLRATKHSRGLSSVVRDVAAAALQILRDGPPRVLEDPSGGPGRISTINYSDLTVKDAVGKGAFGEVCRGYHKKWMVDVAVKKLNSKSREESVKRSKALMEEANFMYRARNANRFIVGLYGVCIEDTFTAMIMEFMANGSVGDLLSRVKHVPWALKWRILQETILGMNFLHSLDPQIIHRDLKVQNVLLDEDFHAKISDFGLAEYKPLTSIGDEKGNLCGTITHIAPEHFKDPYMKAGAKFDAYSFGIFIWEVLTGKRPYREIGIGGIIRERVMEGRRPDKKHIPREGPNELSFFVHLMEKCWDQDPQNRPTFRELGEQVKIVTQKTNAQVAQAIQDVLKEQGEVDSTHQSQRLDGRLASLVRKLGLG
ncbi:PREDICTED: uncharacterized protein LOC109483959 isoform X2 [Branchiostoma belcheri]|uniref:Uncharacterized protein LOC109483959 isoform X2 n=1 Tax=Branchiostoma belcheri TaxID=7741 RepID=A0A6P5A8Z0_BRABE|nr:PREDICTED: uncharacterized protein LOC109483959 isoform X2 [Branchiostoma belcheri]